ncbi:hypothetical protein BN2475_990003 [Paraburkholderia ribeironis]|uniref:Uncharacterized protein n=1 Tax=Paraburkholderia ribeironis TaxID=1247936 RepID=A0A1N7SLX0_9BURK|nr:hypothetical protein BN2475_990003 [Paraburkholderia ribeironis]
MGSILRGHQHLRVHQILPVLFGGGADVLFLVSRGGVIEPGMGGVMEPAEAGSGANR